MAKISSYTTVTAAAGDKVIGTDVAGTPANGTKNFLVEDIAGLATLTQVLTAGNTADNLNIVLTGTGSLNAVNSTLSGTLGVTGESTLSGNVVLGNTLTAGGGVGSSGQVLSSTGTGVQWADEVIPDLQAVLTAGNTATNLGIILGGASGFITVGGGSSGFTGNVKFESTIMDAVNSTGSSGQVLTSTGTQIAWADEVIPDLQAVLTAGNTATNLGIILGGASGFITVGGGSSGFTGNVKFESTIMDAVNSTGSSGQVLTSTGTQIAWANTDPVLTLVEKTLNYTAVNGDLVGCRTGPFTVSPPPSIVGNRFGVSDIINNANTDNITIDFNAQGTKWNSQASDLVMNKDSFYVVFEYIGGIYGWIVVGGAIP